VYRYYHQSFNVYGLQETTGQIVKVLASLPADLPLNADFMEIVSAGTGKTLEAPPNGLPSGWASVLYLYGLR
jgi:hypothetical protein